MTSDEKPILIALSIQSTKREPYITPHGMARSAVVRGESTSQEHSFTFQTGLLNQEQIRRCDELSRHGFTVVELPDDWRWNYQPSPGGWQEAVIQRGMQTMQTLYGNDEEVYPMGYDEKLAEEVLAALNKSFPYPITTAELKHALDTEPSDDVLLTALDALQLQGWISGKYRRSQRRLISMANIQITAEGRRQIDGHPKTSAAAVIHGDQINNYGQAGALGRYATGTINYQQQWTAIQDQIDLSALARELEQMRDQVQKNASTRADFVQLGVLAEAEELAEKHEGSKVLETLSKAGAGLLDIAKDIGTDLAAKVIAKSLGLEP
jgi:hypothetical protein